LENKLCLAVTATVADGDLVVEGGADGAVEVVAVSDGAAVIRGKTVLGQDEQQEGRITCRNRAWVLDTLVFNGRTLGFFLRGPMR
jgi:hypothetical protein